MVIQISPMATTLVNINLFEIFVPGEILISFHVIQDIHRLAVISALILETAQLVFPRIARMD